MLRPALHQALALGTLVLVCFSDCVRGQGSGVPRRVVDIDGREVVDPEIEARHFAAMGAYLYFPGLSGTTGVELFRTGIQTAKVELVKDIAAGVRSSDPFGLTVVGNSLFFFASSVTTGFELWMSDGTGSGTALVKDIYPGLASSLVPSYRAPAAIGELNGSLLFGAEDGAGAYGLWSSDGTAVGTVRLMILGSWSGRTPLEQFISAGQYACFVLPDATIQGSRVWITDGTTIGTRSVLALPNVSTATGSRVELHLVKTTVFVVMNGYLWTIDANAVAAAPIVQGSGMVHSGLGSLPDPNNPQRWIFYFSAGTQLWKSDGTILGTGLFYPLGAVGILNSYRQNVAHANGRMFFFGFDLPHGEEVWSSNGTRIGTEVVTDIRKGPLGSVGKSTGSGELLSSGQLIFVAADDGSLGVELYSTDGTSVGTRMVADLNPGSASSNPQQLLSLGGGDVAFLADDGSATMGALDLFVSTLGQGMRKVASNFAGHSTRTRESRVLGLMAHDEVVYFAADDGVAGSELWRTDGNSANTSRVSDLWAGSGAGLHDHDWSSGHSYGELQGVSLGRDLYFTGYRGDRKLALYKTDGSAAAPNFVRDLDLNGGFGWGLQGLGIGDTLYSYATSRAQGPGLYSFGSGSSMTRLASVLPGSCHQFGSKLVFTDGSPPNLRGIWVSDGSLAGTVPLLRYGQPVFAPFCIVNLGQRMFFSTTHAGGQLFESDGTAAGTKAVRNASIRGMVVVEDRLFALEHINGSMCLTVGDGSAANTVVIRSSLPASVVGLWAAGSKVFFHGFVAGTTELWVSDGSTSGTRRVQSFTTPGTELPRLEGMLSVGSRRVFFRVVHSQGFGVELWQSDGTVLGTHPIADIYPGPGSGVDHQLTQARGKLFFRGDDGKSGSLDGDLWSFDVGAVSYQVGSGCAASGFPPRLTGTDPVVGGTMRVQVDGKPSSVGLLLLGTPATPVIEMGFACRLFLDLGVGFGLGFQTSPRGRWHMSNVRVPNISGTSGLRLVMQVALGPSNQGPFGLDFSPGLVLIAGN